MFKLICLLTTLNILGADSSNEYMDPVIDLILNSENSGSGSSEDVKGSNPPLIAGIWKCGNCTDIDDSKLVYSENNNFDAEMEGDNVETQIELIHQDMRCVTVAANKPGVVQRISGACDGAVILHVAPAQHFIVQVYV